MTAKAWYWTGLGLLAISFVSSSTGRCLLSGAEGLVRQVRTHAVPYVGMAEIALGHTDAGFGHIQSAAGPIASQRVRMEAAQARLQAAQVRLQAAAARREFQQMNIPSEYASFSDQQFDLPEMPEVSVGPEGVIVRSGHGKIACPQGRVQVSVPEISVRTGSANQDPI